MGAFCMINNLENIIKQAVENGFDFGKWCFDHEIPLFGLYEGSIKYLMNRGLLNLLLLNKEFNKCYWGEENCCPDCGGYAEDFGYGLHGTTCWGCQTQLGYDPDFIKLWKYHLQNLVLEDNKVEYFKRGLK